MPSYLHASYNDGYSTCKKCYVVLRIYSASISPQRITDALGVKPTQWAEKGRLNEFTNPKRAVISRQNNWFLSSERVVASRDLRRHLDYIISTLADSKGGMQWLQSLPDTSMTLTCYWWSEHNEGGPVIWPSQMKALVDLDLELGFEYTFFDDDDDAD